MVSKKVTIFIFFIMLAGCSRDLLLSGTYASSLDLVLNLLEPKDPPYTQEMIEAIPYASSIISFETDKRSLIILETQEPSGNYWISADRVRLKELDGRIIQTIGLPNDIYSIERPKVQFEQILAEGYLEHYAYYSFRNPTLNNLKVFITSKVIGKVTTDTLSGEKELILIEEEFFAKTINWKGINNYWIDPVTYFVWKSNQSISPKLPRIQLEVTKKPAR